jgi:hypothetical protein
MRFLALCGPSIGLFLACLFLGSVEILANRNSSLNVLIWPPVGVALGGCIAFGRRAWIGLFLSFFLLLFWQTQRGHFPTSIQDELLLSGCMAFVYIVQAIFTVQLIRFWLPPNCIVLGVRQVLIYLLLIGPVYCLIAPWIGTLMSCRFGLLTWENYLVGVFRWWWSDALSGLIFCTITLALVGQPGSSWLVRRWTVGVPIALASTVVFLATVLVSNRDERPVLDKLAEEARLAEIRTQQRIDRTIQASMGSWTVLEENRNSLQTVKAREMIWSHLVSFRIFSPELVNVIYAPIITADKRDAFETQLSRQAKTPFEILDRNSAGVLTRAEHREAYAPVTVQGQWPRESNFQGFDMLANPLRGPAIREALRTRRPISTGVIPVDHHR